MRPAVTIKEFVGYVAFWSAVFVITAIALWTTQPTELQRHENLMHGRHTCSYCDWNPKILP